MVRVVLPGAARCTIVAVGVIIAGCVTTGRTHGSCTNRVLEQIRSPGGDLNAVVFERRCGEPPSFSTHVSVLTTGARLPEKSGNVFIAIGKGPETDLSLITVSWDGPERLRVSFPQNVAVFRSETAIGRVKIGYVRRGGAHDGIGSPK